MLPGQHHDEGRAVPPIGDRYPSVGRRATAMRSRRANAIGTCLLLGALVLVVLLVALG